MEGHGGGALKVRNKSKAGVAVTQMMIYNTQRDMKHTTQLKHQINNQRRAAC